MSTIHADPEAKSDEAASHHGHGHDHDHDHPAFLAHHFDTPEQQFDSGKLGIWLFLVTEVLFFSGMFCAYAIFRMLRPDVFEGCSEFLNTQLGAINTGVLLFSSLTMAWAVRCSQTEEHEKLVGMIATTLSCAMIFLGVKTIEYSHKWEMGLLPAGLFTYDPAMPHGTGDHPNYLLWLCAPFAVIAAGCIAWLIVSIVLGKQFQTRCAAPLTVVALSFFLGVGLGMFLESGEAEGGHHEDSHAHVAHADGEGHAEQAEGHDDSDHSAHVSEEEVVYVEATSAQLTIQERLAEEATNTGLMSEVEAREAQAELADRSIVPSEDLVTGGITEVERNVMTRRQAGVFFSIYYCMTGIHAIHILAGIGVLVWLLVRAVRHDFNPQYFGPVDYVGLYWHLVDLIWIYLFPLLYLIR
ncbi:MAG: cytochrome c oxidase subunit 3 [Planctomycetota bacterium]